MLVLLQLPWTIYNKYNVLDVGRIVHVITVPAAVYLYYGLIIVTVHIIPGSFVITCRIHS